MRSQTHGGGAGCRAQVLLLQQAGGVAIGRSIVNVLDLLVQDLLHRLPLEQDRKPKRCGRKEIDQRPSAAARAGGRGGAPHSIMQMRTTSGDETFRQQLQHLLAHAPQRLCAQTRRGTWAQAPLLLTGERRGEARGARRT